MKGKSEIIINGLKPTNLVEKSYPLLMMKQVPFSLGELKILDTYLSRINARNVESRTVSFSKAEYESLMGIDRMRPERLAKYVDSMMGKIVTLPEGNGWRKYVLFTSSRCYKREDNDEWWIDITCSPEAKKFFFNIEGIGYLKYQLKNTLSLKSVNSLLLYWYLRANVFRGTLVVNIGATIGNINVGEENVLGKISGELFKVLAYGVVLVLTMFKTNNLAKSILGAH